MIYVIRIDRNVIYGHSIRWSNDVVTGDRYSYIYNNDARNDELFFRLGRMRVLFIILSAQLHSLLCIYYLFEMSIYLFIYFFK